MGRWWKNFEEHDSISLDCLEQTVGRNTDFKDYASEDSEGNEDTI